VQGVQFTAKAAKTSACTCFPPSPLFLHPSKLRRSEKGAFRRFDAPGVNFGVENVLFLQRFLNSAEPATLATPHLEGALPPRLAILQGSPSAPAGDRALSRPLGAPSSGSRCQFATAPGCRGRVTTVPSRLPCLHCGAFGAVWGVCPCAWPLALPPYVGGARAPASPPALGAVGGGPGGVAADPQGIWLRVQAIWAG
jgi:hypothetical protein